MNARPLIHVEPRPADQLKRLVTTPEEFLAQMIALRNLAKISQMECDQQSGMQIGYTGKLEIGLRRAIHESFWWWLPVLSDGVVIVPRHSAKPNACPCCGSQEYLRY